MRLLAILLLCLTTHLSAASSQVGSSAMITIPSRQRLLINPTNINVPSPSLADMNAGYHEISNAVELNCSSNIPWEVRISTGDNNLGSRGGKIKPLSDLEWKRSNRSNWQAISQSAALIQRSNSRIQNKEIKLDLRVLFDWLEDSPGCYSSDLIITLGPRA